MQTTQPNLVHKVTRELVLHDREDDEMVNRVRVGFVPDMRNPLLT